MSLRLIFNKWFFQYIEKLNVLTNRIPIKKNMIAFSLTIQCLHLFNETLRYINKLLLSREWSCNYLWGIWWADLQFFQFRRNYSPKSCNREESIRLIEFLVLLRILCLGPNKIEKKSAGQIGYFRWNGLLGIKYWWSCVEIAMNEYLTIWIHVYIRYFRWKYNMKNHKTDFRS